MSARVFEPILEMVEGRRMTRFRFVCGRCGVTAALNSGHPGVVSRSRNGQVASFDGIEAKMAARKWVIGATANDDRCPNCAVKDAVEKRRGGKPELTVVTTTKEPPVKEMQREDRRIILAKLNEVYLDESRGYENGWTDHRVSEDLGVPRKWVETLREENFGPAGDNEALRRFREEVAALAERATALEKRSAELANEARALRDSLRPLERQSADVKRQTGCAA